MQYSEFLGQFQRTDESKLVLYRYADLKRVGSGYFALNKNVPNWIIVNSPHMTLETYQSHRI